MAIRFVGLETEDVRRLQSGGFDANGQRPERHVSDGSGTPCRHCLANIAEGEPFLVLSYRPFPSPQPYAEQGPIFLHAETCARHQPNGAIPEILDSPQYLVRGYCDEHRIVYGSGRVVATPRISETADEMFEYDRIAYIHVRSAANNCYQCRIERA